MTAPTLDPALMPRIVDIQAGRPARIAGVPVTLNAPVYQLDVYKDDTWGSALIFQMNESQPGLPIFELKGSQTSSIATVLVATTPCGFDNTNATATTGWYKISGTGTDPDTAELVTMQCAHGPLVVRLDPGLTRRPAPTFYPPSSGGCGCGGSILNSLPCGCGGCSGSTPCDHGTVPEPGDCSVLTQRARFKGTYQGTYDPLADYAQWDVVVANGRNYVKVCPDNWGPVTP